MPKKKIGEILKDKNRITEQDLEKALHRQKARRQPIGQILEGMKIVHEGDIADAISEQFNIPYIKEIARYEIGQEALEMLNPDYALSKMVFPLKKLGHTLYLAMADPLDTVIQSELAFRLGVDIAVFVATPAKIKEAIKTHYEFFIPPKTSSGESCLLLHIDNEELALNAARRILDESEISLMQARSGQEGIRMAVNYSPTLILIDSTLPDMSGKTLFNVLGNYEESANVPAIALTNRSPKSDETKLMEAGFYDVITKPFEPQMFMARVKRGLKQTAARGFAV